MSDPTPPEPGEPPRALLAALERVLRPLVRLLLAHGITFPALSRLLKSVYVQVAERDFALEGKRVSDSRVSLLTGVHRKDVRTLRGEGADESPVPEAVFDLSSSLAWRLSDRVRRMWFESGPATLAGVDLLDESYGRLDLAPTISLPLAPAPWLNFEMRGTARFTHYQDSLTEDGTAFTGEALDRFQPSGSASVIGPSISKIFAMPFMSSRLTRSSGRVRSRQ